MNKTNLIPLLAVLWLFSCSKSGSNSTSTTGAGSTSPVVSQFSPTAAPVDSIVTITGSNFSTNVADDIVRFNDTVALVKSATANQLTVVVPAGASTGKITVAIGSQTATSTQNFVVTDHWTFVTSYPESDVWPGISFSLGDNLYTGMGQDLGASGWEQSFWKYNIDAGAWTKMTNFPGSAPYGGWGFAIAGKGYVIHIDSSRFLWTWEYDTTANGWNRLTNAPYIENGGIVFVINNKAFAGLGLFSPVDPEYRMWEFDPVAGTWTQKQNFPGTGINTAAVFVIGNYAYVGTGLTDVTTASTTSEFWQYDPAADTWTKKNDFPGGARGGASAFAINGKGYLGLGQSTTGTELSDWWQYDPSTDSWKQKSNFPGGARTQTVTFTGSNNLGYVGFGQGLGHQIEPNVSSNAYTDLWQYQP